MELFTDAENRRSENEDVEKPKNKNDRVSVSERWIEYQFAKAIGHLGGECGGEILSVGQDGGAIDGLQGQSANCLTARYFGAQAVGTYIAERELNEQKMIQMDETKGLADAHRIYDGEGLARTLKGEGGGLGAKTGLYVIGGLQEHQHWREDGISPTLTKAMGEGGGQTPIIAGKSQIRRLTPIECMRLQGFPDDWADLGDYNGVIKPLSDTAKYRCAGNAVTTNVIEAVITRMLEVGCL